MKRLITVFVVLGFIASGISCATSQQMAASYPSMGPIPAPSPGYDLKVDNLLIIADVSRSMKEDAKVEAEKAFLTSFNSAIPEGLTNAGMRNFGRSAYYHTELVRKVKTYDRTALSSLIGDLQAGWGNTPLASALMKAEKDLALAEGNIAILVVSDGENLTRDPVTPTLALKEVYGDRLCLHTVHVGDSEKGRKMMMEVARHSGCGIAATAAELQSRDKMKKFVADVFYAHEFVDSDGDGVPDWADKCPNTPKGVKVDKAGCPLDSDGDGVPDYLDKCPGTPKGVKVDAAGCPLDSDGDGVPDYLDKCPNTPKGVDVDSAGCWIAKGLRFDYDKAEIRPEFYPVLDKVVRVLEMNPTMKIEVLGHTDSAGSQTYNLELSARRARAVKEYMVSKGIETTRIIAIGKGEMNPIATNDTPEGRAQNRRVEFNVISQ